MDEGAIRRTHCGWHAALLAATLLAACAGAAADPVFSSAIELPGVAHDATHPHPFSSVLAHDFIDTFFLATDRPALNLPTGYSAHSVSARIVDNRMQGVPLPSSLYLLGTALLALFRPRRERHTQH